MKIIKYLIPALTALMAVSCAEEGPYVAGSLDAKVEVTQITATTAVFNIDLSACADVLSLTDEYDRPAICTVMIDDKTHYWMASVNVSDGEQLILKGSTLMDNLEPSTTYHYFLELNTTMGTITYQRPSFTFTTAKEGDYSAITRFEPYEVMTGDQLAVVNFKSFLDVHSYDIILSENPDMSDPIPYAGAEGYQGAELSQCNQEYDTNLSYEYTIAFKGLKPLTKYYWTISGEFSGNGINIPHLISDTFSFTTTDKPDEIVAQMAASIPDQFYYYSGYCSLDNFWNRSSGGYEATGYIKLYEDSDFKTEANYSYLPYRHSYYYNLYLSGVSGTYKGNYISYTDFTYYPQNAILTTPAEQ